MSAAISGFWDQVNFLVGRTISIERFSSQEVKAKAKVEVEVEVSRFAGVLPASRDCSFVAKGLDGKMDCVGLI